MNNKKLESIRTALIMAGVCGLTCSECSIKTGFMRVTIDKYFKILEDEGVIFTHQKGPAKIRIHKKAALNDLNEMLKTQKPTDLLI